MTAEAQPEGRRIHVKDAKLSTASITIRHLMVEGRKLTMAVFRQIPHERLIDLDRGVLFGEVWGHVNYWYPGYEKPDPGALHVVWQKGEELRLFVMSEDLYQCDVDRTSLHQAESQLRESLYWTGLVETLSWLETTAREELRRLHFDTRRRILRDLEKAGFIETRPGYSTKAVEELMVPEPRDAYGRSRDVEEYREQESRRLDRLRAMRRTAREGVESCAPPDQSRAEITRLEQQWAQLYEQLKKVPHVFIAT